MQHLTAVDLPHLFLSCLVTELFSGLVLVCEEGVVSGMYLVGFGEERIACVPRDRKFSLSSLTLPTVAFNNDSNSLC